jgi:hypothetical protein
LGAKISGEEVLKLAQTAFAQLTESLKGREVFQVFNPELFQKQTRGL